CAHHGWFRGSVLCSRRWRDSCCDHPEHCGSGPHCHHKHDEHARQSELRRCCCSVVACGRLGEANNRERCERERERESYHCFRRHNRRSSESYHFNELRICNLHLRIYWPRCVGCCLKSEEHTSELQSRENLVCRLLLE